MVLTRELLAPLLRNNGPQCKPQTGVFQVHLTWDWSLGRRETISSTVDSGESVLGAESSAKTKTAWSGLRRVRALFRSHALARPAQSWAGLAIHRRNGVACLGLRDCDFLKKCVYIDMTAVDQLAPATGRANDPLLVLPHPAHVYELHGPHPRVLW